MSRIAVVTFLFFYSINSFTGSAAIFYVDSILGNDENTGKSENAAWKSVFKINTFHFSPGDIILLKRGTNYASPLILSGSGVPGKPIILGAYGIGRRPLIDGGNSDVAVKMMNEQHWIIQDIEIMGGKEAGIFIGCNRYNTDLSNIRISNCFVHDVGDTLKRSWDYSKVTGGIIIYNGELVKDGIAEYNSVFNDITIENCIVRYINRWNGISISSGRIEAIRGKNNRIRNCTVEYTAADGIRMNGVQNSLIEYCVMYRNGAWPNLHGPNLGGLGAWFFNAENCTIQFCEASYVDSPAGDGGAFDIDYWQRGGTVQYCYGHDCHGYGVSIFGADPLFPTENSVVRYNIFSNNARDTAYSFQGDYYLFTWKGGLLNGVNIYNNTSYWNPASKAPALNVQANFAGTNTNYFKNNIIYSTQSDLVYRKNDYLTLANNFYWFEAGCKEKYNHLNGELEEHNFQALDTLNHLHSNLNSPPKKFLKLIPSGKRKISKELGVGDSVSFFGTNSSTRVAERMDDGNGEIILLSFITGNDEDSRQDAVRSQLCFINSIKRQFLNKEVRIVLVCKDGAPSTLSNFIRDAEIEDVTLINGIESKKLIKKFEVLVFPTNFLVERGTISQRWNNLALSCQLAFAIKQASNWPENTSLENTWSTQAQTIFPGLGAARPLSEKLWMIDENVKWEAGKSTPLRFVILSKEESCYLNVEAINVASKKVRLIYDGSVVLLPEDECKIMIRNTSHSKVKAFMTTLSTTLSESGAYCIRAYLQEGKSKRKSQTAFAWLTVD